MSLGRTLVEKYAGRTVLGIGAHPDDLELAVGGTIPLLSRAGVKVVMAVICVPSNLKERIAEQERAASLLGASVHIVYPERCLRVEDLKTYELVERIDKLVLDFEPAAMLTHSSANFHKDHVLVHHACLASQRLNYFDLFCYNPTSTRPIPIAFHPQAYVDITETIERKLEAIQVHSSQFQCRSLGTDHYRDAARETGRMAGVAYAEGLEVLRLRLN